MFIFLVPFSEMWGYKGSIKSLSVENAATGRTSQNFPQNFQQQLPYYN
jgi:hypothetical protein